MNVKHLKITASSLAQEAGMTRQSLYNNYIKEFLENHPLYSKRDKKPDCDEDNKDKELEELKAEMRTALIMDEYSNIPFMEKQ